MARAFISVCVAIASAFVCGCRTSYKEALQARENIMFGTGEVAASRAARMAASVVNRKLGNMELGRIRMLQGDFAASSALLGPQLEELFDDSNEGPVLKKGQIAGNVLAGTLADDRAIPYELPAFELILALQYQALNSLALGERDNARVYLRRATAAQEQIKDEIDESSGADTESEDAANAANATSAANDIAAKLAPVADAVRASYENALAWYLMGLFFAKEGDPGNAAIAYGEAAKISPAVMPFVDPAPGAGRDVIVVYEEDLVDIKEPIKIPLPFGGTIWSVDFPVYSADPRIPAQVSVEVGGALATTCSPVVNVRALAYRDLKDRIPGIATRNVTRAAVKIAAQQVANHVKTGNSSADLAISLGVLLYNAASTTVNEADTRAWQTVPEFVHMARLRVPEQAHSLTLRNVATGRHCEVQLPDVADGTVLVWFTDVRGFATVTTIPIGWKGQAGWARTESLLGR